MKKCSEIYKELTNVNIEEQYKLWDERGKGYYGEYLVFCELYKKISGNCKILMNLQIPVKQRKTTEIDLLIIHETGIYVFEIKHYKGTIYGEINENSWTQYFRTTPNSYFKNPVKQNQYHINALEELRIRESIPFFSFIVFTSDECELKVTGEIQNTQLCELYKLTDTLNYFINKKEKILNMEQIDGIFNLLLMYSPFKEKPVTVEETIIPFEQYLNEIIKDYNNEIEKIKLKIKDLYRNAICIGVLSIVCSISVCIFYNYQRNKELDAFARKFEYVDVFNNGKLEFSKELSSVDNVVLKKSKDINNALIFSCNLTSVSEDYGISVGENAKIIIMLTNGNIKEYSLWNEKFPFKSEVHIGSLFDTSGIIGRHEFYDINIEDISYIKLINLGVWNKNQYPIKNIINTYEVELYSKKNN